MGTATSKKNPTANDLKPKQRKRTQRFPVSGKQRGYAYYLQVNRILGGGPNEKRGTKRGFGHDRATHGCGARNAGENKRREERTMGGGMLIESSTTTTRLGKHHIYQKEKMRGKKCGTGEMKVKRKRVDVKPKILKIPIPKENLVMGTHKD